MYDIVFVNPPTDTSTFEGRLARKGGILPPLGLLALAAYTRKEGFSTALLDAFCLGLNFEDTAKEVINLKTKAIGITTFTATVQDAAKIARIIKDLNSEINIIIGGSHISALPADTMNRFPQFDIGVIGEGELTIIDLLRKKEPRDIAGIIYRDNKKLITNKKRERIKELGILPFPAFDLLPGFPEKYSAVATNFKKLPTTSLVTTRGCPYQCTFCDRHIYGNLCASHDAGYIIELIEKLKDEYNIKDISFYDDTFVALKDRLRQLCQMMIDENIDISWSCLSRVDLINTEMLTLMKNAGCWQVSYGIESGSQKILDAYKKNITIKQIKNAVNMTKKAGLSCRGFFMLGNPMETQDTIRDTEKIITLFDDICMSFFTPLPGAEVFEDIKNYGEAAHEWSMLDIFNPNFIPNGLTKKDLLEAYRRIHIKFYLRPKIVYNYLMKIIKNREIKKVFLGFGAFLQLISRKQNT